MFVLLLLSCERWSDPTKLQDDIDKMCTVAKTIDRKGTDDDQQVRELGQKLVAEHVGPLGTALVKLVLETPPHLRRKVVNAYLAKNGIDGLDCPPLARILYAEK